LEIPAIRAALSREERQERARLKALEKAFSLLQSNPDYPSVEVQIYDQEKEIQRSAADESERFSEARMDYALRWFDIHAAAYSRLVTDLESHKAFAGIVGDLLRRSWLYFSGGLVPLEEVPPVVVPPAKTHPWRIQADKMNKKAHHWLIEALRPIAQPQGSARPARRGYRKEVRVWMQKNEIDSVKVAAHRLGVSDSVLKSIMATKGKVRYGHGTLQSVLEQIGFKSGDQVVT
jgi:hypothetical protein